MTHALVAVPLSIRLPDGELATVADWTIHAPPVEYVRSRDAVQPDPGWRHTDAAGHVHWWIIGPALKVPGVMGATRSSMHVACDGSCSDEGCDGYPVTVWHCTTCGEELNPGWRPDHHARTVGVPVRTGGGPRVELALPRVDLAAAHELYSLRSWTTTLTASHPEHPAEQAHGIAYATQWRHDTAGVTTVELDVHLLSDWSPAA